jgi:hypothetical protein
VQTIKAVARRRWEKGEKRSTTTWYHAFEDPEDIERAVHWALARPGVFVNTASDPTLLRRSIDAAQSFKEAPSEEAMGRAVEKLDVKPLFLPGYDGLR